jgi:hypothetical protein
MIRINKAHLAFLFFLLVTLNNCQNTAPAPNLAKVADATPDNTNTQSTTSAIQTNTSTNINSSNIDLNQS